MAKAKPTPKRNANQPRGGNGKMKTLPYSLSDVDGKEHIDKLKEFDNEYSGLGLDPLMLYTLAEMEKLKIRLSAPNATMAILKIFPKKFTLFGWGGVPDGARAASTLWHLIDKGKKWTTGTPNQYIITERGRRKLEDANLMLKIPGARKCYSQTRRPEKLLGTIRKAEAFKKYKKGQELSQFDFYNILQCTLDSSQSALKENYDALCDLAKDADAVDVMEFLKKLKNNFKEIVNA